MSLPEPVHPTRIATPDDAALVARLLDDFNREFDTPTPGVDVLERRLRTLLAADRTAAILTAGPAVGVALITFRPSVWSDGETATLDELYVRPDLRGRRYGHALLEAATRLATERGAGTFEINVDGVDVDARRFYEAHGFACVEPGETEPMYFYYRDLT